MRKSTFDGLFMSPGMFDSCSGHVGRRCARDTRYLADEENKSSRALAAHHRDRSAQKQKQMRWAEILCCVLQVYVAYCMMYNGAGRERSLLPSGQTRFRQSNISAAVIRTPGTEQVINAHGSKMGKHGSALTLKHAIVHSCRTKFLCVRSRVFFVPILTINHVTPK